VLVVGLSLVLSAGHAQSPARHPLICAVGAVGMTVGDMERSVAFYAGVLGFEKVSDAEVRGEEYEQLPGIFGLRIRVVRMRLGDEAIELTEYLTPRDGRPAPADTRPNDLVHWQTTLASDDAEAGAWAVRRGSCAMLSSGVVTPADRALDFTKGLVIRDPDGHALKVV
jgi:catechol 2,3-dioxygenase-like lactoylglutathione lyase family enzyme